MDPRKLALTAAALAALALAPDAARAQERIPFDTIVKSAFGGSDKAEQRAIYEEAEYRAFFHGSPPATPAVRWGEEAVIAISLGARATSGYSIEVTRIVKGVGLNLRHVGFVEDVERAPKPGDVTASVVTQPVHVVKVPNGITWSYVYTHDAALARGFDEVSLAVADGDARAFITVGRDGRAVASVRDSTGKVSAQEGPLSSVERWLLDEAYAYQDLMGLPDTIAGATSTSAVILTIRAAGKTKTFRAPFDRYADAQSDVTDRVSYVVEELRATAERIAPSKAQTATLRGRLGAIYYTEDSLAIYLEGSLHGALEIRDARFLAIVRRAEREGRTGAGPIVAHGRAVTPGDLTSTVTDNTGTVELDWVEGRFAGQTVRVVGESATGAWTYVTLGAARIVVPTRLVTIAV